MPIAFYMDHNVPRGITSGLRIRGIDVLTAYEDGANEFDDSALLDRASELERVLFTQDDDLLAEANDRQRNGTHFCGVIYAHQIRVPIGECIRNLELIGKAANLEELTNQVLYIPL